jgi:hypothetical protein
MVATVVLAAAWLCPVAYANHYILCQDQKCDVFEIPDEPYVYGQASRGWKVDQVYSNANGSIQFIVLSKTEEQKCSGLSVFSIHDGVENGVAWTFFPRGSVSADRLLIATEGFYSLGIVSPDATVGDGFLGTGAGVIRLCDGSEFPYAALPTDGVMALDVSGSPVRNVATNLAGVSGSVTAQQAASRGLRFNEGLTGSWFEPATSGQGFEVEFAEDYVNFGFNVMLSWFTYDHTVAGGAEHQRWYTLHGHAGPGEGAFPLRLDIFENVGGNFNAGPTTAGRKVGSATLKFAACDQGALDYTFSDGSNRSGSISIKRLTQDVTCFRKGNVSPVHADFAFSGNWYDPVTSGQGITVEINPVSGVAFMAWYTYAPNAAQAGAAGQRWYTAQSAYTAGARTVAMTIYETTGGLFDSSNPLPRSTAVGMATLAFQDCRAATLTYSFTAGSSAGAKGTMSLSRVMPFYSDCGT